MCCPQAQDNIKSGKRRSPLFFLPLCCTLWAVPFTFRFSCETDTSKVEPLD